MTVVGAWSVAIAIGRVWFPRVRRRRGAGKLPPWPVADTDPAPAVVVGEQHHPVAYREEPDPRWLTIPERGLYTGVLVCGAIGSGKTSACMRPFARQLLGWQAEDRRRRAAGLVLEVKGDFCHQVRGILEEAGRGEDYVELGLGGRWRWNPLGDDQLDSYSLAYTIASLINQLFGRSKEPFWQQAYVNLVRWIVELHRMRSERWMTLRDVYRCTLDPKRIEALIAEVEARVEAPVAVRIASTDFAAQVSTLGAWAWKGIGGGRLRTGDDRRLREQLASLGVAFEVEKAVSADPARWERLDAVRRWYHGDWKALDQKLRSSIIEGLSVFLSVFDLPDVAATFCPPKPPSRNDASASREDAAAVDRAPVARQLPRLDDVIDSGKVLALNMPAGTNSALSRAVGVMLKQAWLQTLLRRPAEMQAHPAPASTVPPCSSATSTRRSQPSARQAGGRTSAASTRLSTVRPATSGSRRTTTGWPASPSRCNVPSAGCGVSPARSVMPRASSICSGSDRISGRLRIPGSSST
ncbi:MAG: hypothetical protein OXQ28_06795, partial [Acidobacteriota bacterium]|nr:hypothetical protein [Acidobacteriota bacterium]